MSTSTNRRQFLGASIAAAAATAVSTLHGTSREANAESQAAQEFYELRSFEIADEESQSIVLRYLETALIPALAKLGVDRVGAFTRVTAPDAEADHSVDVLIPYKSLDVLAGLSLSLAKDSVYAAASKEYFSQPAKRPPYARIHSRLMKAFASMPVVELPEMTRAKKPRIFELRIYESPNEDAAFRKVDMFDQGETQIMREAGLAPVFYGETLISDDVPNLTYMLSAPDMEAHGKHWKAFGAHPEWKRMKKIEKYKGTVSKIRKRFLVPASFSAI